MITFSVIYLYGHFSRWTCFRVLIINIACRKSIKSVEIFSFSCLRRFNLVIVCDHWQLSNLLLKKLWDLKAIAHWFWHKFASNNVESVCMGFHHELPVAMQFALSRVSEYFSTLRSNIRSICISLSNSLLWFETSVAHIKRCWNWNKILACRVANLSCSS